MNTNKYKTFSTILGTFAESLRSAYSVRFVRPHHPSIWSLRHPENGLTHSHGIWYGRYAIEGFSKLVNINFLQPLTKTDTQTCEVGGRCSAMTSLPMILCAPGDAIAPDEVIPPAYYTFLLFFSNGYHAANSVLPVFHRTKVKPWWRRQKCHVLRTMANLLILQQIERNFYHRKWRGERWCLKHFRGERSPKCSQKTFLQHYFEVSDWQL
jgi:hypothetical protein